MHAPQSQASPDQAKAQDSNRGADHIAPDCAGQNFYAIDRGLRDLLRLYLQPNDFRRLEPHFDRLGALAGGRLDELARAADKHPPVLNARDRFGRDEDWIDYHSSYREMEAIAFGDFQFHAMSHRAGTLDIDRPLPAVAKYALQYLFVQAEFGLMCPISVTDTSIHLIRKFASTELKDYLLPKMLSADAATQWKGTQFMTERAGGSDRRRDRNHGELRGRGVAAPWRQMVLLACRRGRGAAAGAAGRRAPWHQGACAVCPAPPAAGRPPQYLSHRSRSTCRGFRTAFAPPR
jgi:acyl-CoA dehydrogenase